MKLHRKPPHTNTLCHLSVMLKPQQKRVVYNRAYLLFILCILLVAIPLVYRTPNDALASPTHIEGTCYIECTNHEIDGSTGGNIFRVSFPQYGITTTGYCISGPLYGTPLPGNYPFTGARGEDGSYAISIDCSGAEMYSNHYSQFGAQDVGNFTIKIYGDIRLSKHGIEGYSQSVAGATLAGARYELRDASGALYTTLTTDEAGLASICDIPLGTYTLQEIEAPFGYGLDEQTYTLSVTGGAITSVDSWEEALLGAISLEKTSAYPCITDNNSCYSLANATYGIYDDAACQNEIQRIVTNDSGYAQSVENLWPQTYWIKEIAAPLGYALDEQIYPVTLSVQDCHQTTVPCINLCDTPLLAPVDVVAKKIDSETNDAQPQGDATLQGAVFSVLHYGEILLTQDEVEHASVMPTNLGKVTTDENGVAYIAQSALAHTDAGYGFALGTVVIQEITPPQGYLLPAQNTFICPVTTSGSSSGASSDPSSDSSSSRAVFYPPTVIEDVILGDIALIKVGDGEGTTGDQNLKSPLANVAFDIIHAQSKEVVARIVTDENGCASTALPREGNISSLPFGTYLVQEDPSTTPAGYHPAPAFPVTIAQHGKTYPFVIENTTGTIVRVVKRDAETDQPISGYTTFRILNDEKEPVCFNASEISEEPLDTFTTDETGTCTLPRKLNGGKTYYLQEIQAPEGYILAKEPVAFTLSTPTSPDESDLQTIEVSMYNKPQMGRILIEKTDAETKERISQPDITWDIRAASDIVGADKTIHARAGETVGQMTSDENGYAHSTDLYLGSYEIVETHAPVGYVRAQETLPVELLYGEQSLESIEIETSMQNQRAKGRIEIQKTDDKSGDALAGATYKIYAITDADAQGNNIDINDSDAIDTLTTDEAGQACSITLPLGTYCVVETAAPQGYALDTQQHEVKLTYQGEDIACVKETLALTDSAIIPLPAKTSIVKTGDYIPSGSLILAAVAAITSGAYSFYRYMYTRRRNKNLTHGRLIHSKH